MPIVPGALASTSLASWTLTVNRLGSTTTVPPVVDALVVEVAPPVLVELVAPVVEEAPPAPLVVVVVAAPELDEIVEP
jgi:hypothetical protein